MVAKHAKKSPPEQPPAPKRLRGRPQLKIVANTPEPRSDPMPDLLTVAEFARRCSISPSMVWKLMRGGTIKPLKIGASTRIAATEIQRLIESRSAS